MRKGNFKLSPFKVVPLAVLCLGAQAVGASSDGMKTKWYGNVNRAALFADDGRESNLHFVDNDKVSSRLGFMGYTNFMGDLKAGGKFELEILADSSTKVWQIEGAKTLTDNNNFILIRHVDFFLDSPMYGKLSLGQGSMASDDSMELDILGNTKLIAEQNPSDIAASYRFHPEGLERQVLSSDPSVATHFSALDGASRLRRVRYDTPCYYGFVASTSYAVNKFDVALRYKQDMEQFKVSAAVAYYRNKSLFNRIDGAASVLHTPTGLGITIGAGRDNLNENHYSGTYTGRTEHPTAYYVKLAWLTNLMACGQTGFVVDYFHSENRSIDDDEGKSFGVAMTQRLDHLNTDFYIGWRNFDLETPSQQYDKLNVVLAGFSYKF